MVNQVDLFVVSRLLNVFNIKFKEFQKLIWKNQQSFLLKNKNFKDFERKKKHQKSPKSSINFLEKFFNEQFNTLDSTKKIITSTNQT